MKGDGTKELDGVGAEQNKNYRLIYPLKIKSLYIFKKQ